MKERSIVLNKGDIMEIRIAGLVNDSIVDGDGLRFAIFTQGCPHNCEGCQNPQTHDFNSGEIYEIEEIIERVLENPLLDGVTFTGGEPFCQAKALSKMAKIFLENNLNIITYTGYTYEYLLENSTSENHYADLLGVTDILIDGKFEIEKKDYNLRFRGSSNQRIIDCKNSLKSNSLILYEY